MKGVSMGEERIEFSNKKLFLIALPLIFEQFLGVAVGLADTIMVSSVGESAVSGVSLVDTINVLLVGIFMALATGGCVIVSQALGRRDSEQACEYSNQMTLTITVIALCVMIFSVTLNKFLLNLMFGDVEKEVMVNARIYFYLTAFSFPFLALQSACGAVFRSMGKTKVTLYVSIAINVLNILGNYFFIMHLGWNAAGVGMSTLVARVLGSVTLFTLALNSANEVHLTNPIKWRFDSFAFKKMMKISLPLSIDTVIFQVGKIVLQSLTATFGTTTIAANAVANAVAGLAIIPGSAFGIVLVIVTGQLIGARQFDDVKFYAKKLCSWGIVTIGIINVILFIFINPILNIYNLTPEGHEIAYNILILHCVTSTLFWTLSFTLPNMLRAANDARYTMFVSIFSMWVFRVGLSYVFCGYFGMGVLGIWLAMGIDWLFRDICFVRRVRSDRWITQSI